MRGRKPVASAAALFCAAGLVTATARGQTPSAPIVLSGQSAPGTANSYTTFIIPYINSKSPSSNPPAVDFVFQAFVDSSAATDLGIWAGTASNITLVAREGSAAPGAPGTTFAPGTFQQPQVDTAGYVSFYSQIQGAGVDGSNNSGIWVGLPGSIQLAARAGDDAVGITDARWSFMAPQTAQIETGRVAFSALLTNKFGAGITSDNDTGIWIGPAGGVALAVRENDTAGGTGARYGDMFQAELVLNSAGKIVFKNTLRGAGIVTGVNDKTLWFGSTPGNQQLLARTGDAAPGGGAFLDFTNKPSLNDSGTIAFRAELVQSGTINTGNDTGIWVGSQMANLTLLAREGTDAPGAGGDDFGNLNETVTSGRAIINGAGRVAFLAPLSGPAGTDRGVFAGSTSGNLTMVARKGDPAPGTGAGVTFGDFSPSVTLNSFGQVAFPAAVAGTGVNGSNDQAIFAVDPFGQLVKVAREGDTIMVNPGDNRTISNAGLSLAGNFSAIEGRPSGFNDSGLVAYSAAFTNGTRGVFTARVGGSARVTAAAPTLGPATGNGFKLVTPAQHFETVPVTGDIGYLRFVGVGPTGGPVLVFLDFTGTNIAGAIAELQRGASAYNYSVSSPGPGIFDAVVAYATAANGDGTNQYFYWNFANIPNVDLAHVQVAPEPGSIGLLALAATALIRRRR